MKPGDVKRPVVDVGEMLGHHGKDKSRDIIHEEPETKTLDEDSGSVPVVKNITWRGRINDKDSGIEEDAHVLKTLTKLREMVLAEQHRNKEQTPGSRFHENNDTKTHHREEDDDTLEQANSIIDKVEKIHSDGEQKKQSYQEEHPDDAKYVIKAQEILKNLPSEINNNSTINNETIAYDKTLSLQEHVLKNESENIAQLHSNEIDSTGQTNKNKTISKSALNEQKEGISKFIADTFGFDMGSKNTAPKEVGKTQHDSKETQGNSQQNLSPAKDKTSPSLDPDNENYQEIIALNKNKKNIENNNLTTTDFAATRTAAIETAKQVDDNIVKDNQNLNHYEEEKHNSNTASKNDSLLLPDNNKVDLKQNGSLKIHDKDLKNNDQKMMSEDDEVKLNADLAFESTKNSTHSTVSGTGLQNTSSKSDEHVEANKKTNNNKENETNNETTEDSKDQEGSSKTKTKQKKPILIDGREGTTQNTTFKEQNKQETKENSTSEDDKKSGKFEGSASLKFKSFKSQSYLNDKKISEKHNENNGDFSENYKKEILESENKKSSEKLKENYETDVTKISTPVQKSSEQHDENNKNDSISTDYELEEVQKASDELFKELSKIDEKKKSALKITSTEKKVENSTLSPQEKVFCFVTVLCVCQSLSHYSIYNSTQKSFKRNMNRSGFVIYKVWTSFCKSLTYITAVGECKLTICMPLKDN